jgi:S-adenosyl-L-methionine hydrolase (adenosine-forming)
MGAQLITFLTDYGRADPFVGVCHAVIAGLAPAVRVVDLTHDITAHDVHHGAATLADCLPWLPPAVHLAVVDPGVGTVRRPVVVAAGGQLLVGPDNGLLWPAAVRLGGAAQAWELAVAPGTPATFHGRDVFAPAAARLAAGAAPDDVGTRVDPGELCTLTLPAAHVADGALTAEVLTVDRFGNVVLWAETADLAAAELRPGEPVDVAVGERAAPAMLAVTFADVAPGEVAVLADAFGRVQVAVNQGSAAAALATRPGDRLLISPRDG